MLLELSWWLRTPRGSCFSGAFEYDSYCKIGWASRAAGCGMLPATLARRSAPDESVVRWKTFLNWCGATCKCLREVVREGRKPYRSVWWRRVVIHQADAPINSLWTNSSLDWNSCFFINNRFPVRMVCTIRVKIRISKPIKQYTYYTNYGMIMNI